MNIEQMNFEDLRSRTDSSPAAAAVLNILQSYTTPRLTHLLRDHHDEEVAGKEVKQRDAFDETLELYSLMEVASIASYVPKRFPDDYKKRALDALSNTAVRVYYETHYPLFLPRLHRERLEGRWNASEEGPELPAYFISFSELSRVIDDDDVEVFLWMLEDGSIDGTSLRDLLAIVKDPERFGAAMMKGSPQKNHQGDFWSEVTSEAALRNPKKFVRQFEPDEDLTYAERSVRGFQRFLFFCRDLDRLLCAASEYPLTQSAMWHFHSYWFDEMSDDLKPYLEQAIEGFAQWSDAPGLDVTIGNDRGAAVSEALAKRRELTQQLSEAVGRLTSGEYGRALRDAHRG
jgi:hypothetical protein